MTPQPCIPTPTQLAAIPADLRETPRWVLWRWEQRGGKWTKPPYTAANGTAASSTDPGTWATCEAALTGAIRHHASGIGVVLVGDDDLIGIDLDHCVASDGTIEDWAADTVRAMDSYAEVSPSGSGLRIFVRGQLPPEGRKRGQVEMYDRERYLTVTGQRVAFAPSTIAHNQGAIDALHARTFPPKPPRQQPSNVTPLTRSDEDLLAMAYNARNGQRFAALLQGDTSAYNGDDSAADAAFTAHLAFWTTDAGQIDRIVRRSGLYREKWNERRGQSTYGRNTIDNALALVTTHYSDRGPITGAVPPRTGPPLRPDDDSEPETYPATDSGNGELISSLYGDILRYDHLRGRWLLWQGHHWADDADGAVQRLAKDAARERLRRAADIADDKEMQREIRWAIQSENKPRIDAGLYMAGREHPITDPGFEWDRDPWLFGVRNGVVDLRTGEIHDGARDDRVTIRTLVQFSPEADCPRWRRFLAEVFSDDYEIVEFVQRAVGYSLTGDVGEQVLFLMVGSGSNGKSTFQSIIRSLAGAYAANTPFATFESASRLSIPTDLAALAGKRIVTCGESAESARLNEGRLKAFVHGDDQTARFLHHDFFTYKPQAHLWLASNHKPRVTDDSLGFWRSVLLIPFRRAFDEATKDKHLEAALREELPGILTWAIDGCLKWQDDGLRPPEAVTIATQEYRQESDPIGEFLIACCDTSDPGSTELGGVIWASYVQFCERSGISEKERIGRVTFFKRLADRFEKRITNAGKAYWGLRVTG